MNDRRSVRVTLDVGALALAMVVVASMLVTAWNWNNARHDCTQLLRQRAERTATAEDVRQCSKALMKK